MTWTRVHQLVAGLVFTVALGVYLATVAPTASFWDCGEFIAIAYKLEVSHPPGAPFFMLIGRLFSMFASPEGAAYAINLVSVLSSAVTVLLTHLIVVRLVRTWQGILAPADAGQHLAALAGGVVGSLAFAFSDAFWFNAVEAEVYAMSMLFTALVVWLMLRWSELARREEQALAGEQRHPFGLQANRYLVVIAYLFGLAIGVHLLNLLAIFFCALIFFWDEYDREDYTTMQRFWRVALAGVVSSGVFLLVYPGVIQGIPKLAEITGSLLVTGVVIVGFTAWLVWYSHTRRILTLNLLALSVVAILIGYSTYGVIFLRSAANPPIDENDPETVENIVSYLMRDQYGSTPLLSGKSYDNATGQISKDKAFPRRWSDQSPYHTQVYSQYKSDSEFFWSYQVGHMYWRYFLWQYMGKASDEQDAPAITGIGGVDAAQATYFQTPSERKSRNVYYALPLLLGLIGMAYHFWRDWRRASAVLLFFLLTGIGIIVYLNQYPGQPRERDYSYVASFFAFAFWIGIGAAGLVELAAHAVRSRGARTMALAGAPVALLCLLAVPVLMYAQNRDDHDRSGNYSAPDYAWNMLQSTAPNAILFTNGDNDTFPLWYLQEVEGVRRDVRVANLSLAQIGWYALQLKNQASRTSAPLPITIPDDVLRNPEAFGAVAWTPSRISLPVPPDAQLVADSVVAPADLARVQRPLQWDLTGRLFAENQAYLGPNDLIVKNIVETNAQQGWKRPVYMAQTVGRDGRLDTAPFGQFEGQAIRLVPVVSSDDGSLAFGRVSPDIALARLGMFRFRGLADTTVYYDENARLMLNNYRTLYTHAADALTAAGRPADAVRLLDELNTKMPFTVIPGDPRSWSYSARSYMAAGADAKAVALARQAMPYAIHRLKTSQGEEQRYAVGFFQMIRAVLIAGGDVQSASTLSSQVATLVGDPSLVQTPEQLRSEVDTARLSLGLALGRAAARTDSAPAASPSAPRDTARR